MAHAKVSPKCSAIKAFKKSILNSPSQRNEILSQTLVNFILWLVKIRKADLFSMDQDGAIEAKSISLDDYIRHYIEEDIGVYLAEQKETKASASYATFRCNLKRVMEFLKENAYTTLDIEKAFPPETILLTHPLVEKFLETIENRSMLPHWKYLLQHFLAQLLNIPHGDTKSYWTLARVRKEKKAYAALHEDGIIALKPYAKSDMTKILKVLPETLEKIIRTGSNNSSLGRRYTYIIRKFYQWLFEQEYCNLVIEKRTLCVRLDSRDIPTHKKTQVVVKAPRKSILSKTRASKTQERRNKSVSRHDVDSHTKLPRETTRKKAKKKKSDTSKTSVKKTTSKRKKNVSPSVSKAAAHAKRQEALRQQRAEEWRKADELLRREKEEKKERQRLAAQKRVDQAKAAQSPSAASKNDQSIREGYIDSNFDSSYFNKRIAPFIEKEQIQEEDVHFILCRNYLLYVFVYYARFRPNALKSMRRADARQNSDQISMGDKKILEFFLSLLEKKNIPGTLLFSTFTGDPLIL